MQISREPIFRRDWKFVIGTILLILSAFVIGAFHIGVLFMFGIPLLLLLIGLVLLLVSRASRRTKASLILVSVAIIPLTFASSIYLSSAEPETFLIPNNYRGQIVVFHDEPCGSELVYENGRRLYEIGNDEDVLITKFKKNRGYLDRKFFYVNEYRERSQIPEFQKQNFETEKKEWSLYSHPIPVDLFTRDTLGAFWAYGTETYGISRNSIAYRVWSYNDLERDDKIRWSENKEFGKEADLILLFCRESGSRN